MIRKSDVCFDLGEDYRLSKTARVANGATLDYAERRPRSRCRVVSGGRMYVPLKECAHISSCRPALFHPPTAERRFLS